MDHGGHPNVTDERGNACPVGAPMEAMQRVSVSLFGALGVLCRERPVVVDVPVGATVADVIAVLGRRLGPDFLADVLEPNGEKFRYCRIFVDGSPVDLDARLPGGGAASKIEFIVMTAFEGG